MKKPRIHAELIKAWAEAHIKERTGFRPSVATEERVCSPGCKRSLTH